MTKFKRKAARLGTLALLIGAGAVGMAAANATNAQSTIPNNRTPYEQCLYDNVLNCRAAYPVGEERSQCMLAGREACDIAHHMQ